MITLSDGTPIVWMACDCYVWPLTLPVHRSSCCGKCGQPADIVADLLGIPTYRDEEFEPQMTARPLTPEEQCGVAAIRLGREQEFYE